MKNNLLKMFEKVFCGGIGQIISEHLNSIDDFRSFNLIFDVELYFFKNKVWLEIFGKLHSIARCSGQEGIYLNQNGEGFWIEWYNNSNQRRVEGYYRNGLKAGLWNSCFRNGNKMVIKWRKEIFKMDYKKVYGDIGTVMVKCKEKMTIIMEK